MWYVRLCVVQNIYIALALGFNTTHHMGLDITLTLNRLEFFREIFWFLF